METPHRILRLIIALAAAMLLAIDVAAQEATPPAGTTEREGAYPVSIHRGTCEDPVAQPVGATIESGVAGFDANVEFIGVSTQAPVLVASAEYEISLDDLTATPHVVAIHASPEAYGTIVACGEIAGYAHDGALIFGVRSVDDSEVSGIAVVSQGHSLLDEALEEIDESVDLTGDSVTLTVYIVPGDEQDDPGA